MIIYGVKQRAGGGDRVFALGFVYAWLFCGKMTALDRSRVDRDGVASRRMSQQTREGGSLEAIAKGRDGHRCAVGVPAIKTGQVRVLFAPMLVWIRELEPVLRS